ncbi:unnamed protein product [[Candida] boidinii]|uniref:Unnamed protein product n=1 Tax=Candida boidinii TaxID=5477 RepID=A0ACB5U5D0_CANBO|nr:unnamed protein product [[Candida] boidinii]
MDPKVLFPSAGSEVDQNHFFTPDPVTGVINEFPFPEDDDDESTLKLKPSRLIKTTKQVKKTFSPFRLHGKTKTIVVLQERDFDIFDEPAKFKFKGDNKESIKLKKDDDEESIEFKKDDEKMTLNSAIISDIDSYLQELSSGNGCKEWRRSSSKHSSTPGLNIIPLVAESSNHFEDSCSIKQANDSNDYHQFEDTGIPTNYCVEEDNNFMKDFQDAPTFGKMEHYIGSQMYNEQVNPFEINNSNISSIKEEVKVEEEEYFKFG